MSKNEKKINKNIMALKHTNLMLVSTTVSICTGLVLLLIYTGLKGTMSSFVFSRTMCGVISAIMLIGAIVLTFVSAKKDVLYTEFAVFAYVMSFAFLSMLGVPFFLRGINGIEKFFVTQYVMFATAVVDVIYLIISLVYHTFKSSEK